MTLKVKRMTNVAVATLMIGMAVWASLKVISPSTQRVVGVVEVGEIQ